MAIMQQKNHESTQNRKKRWICFLKSLLNISEQFNKSRKWILTTNTHQGAKKRPVEIAFFCQELIKFNFARFKKKRG